MGDVLFVTYKDNNDNAPLQQSAPLSDFYDWLLDPEETECVPCKGKKCPEKDGPAWSPGFIPEGKGRRGFNVVGFDVIAFDIDHVTQEVFEALCSRLDAENVDCGVYSTHCHAPPFDGALRLTCTLSRRISRQEHPAVWEAAVRKFGIPADTKSKDTGHIFYTFRVPAGAPRVSMRNEGKPLDVAQLLLGQMAHTREQRKVLTAVAPLEPGEVDLTGLKAHLRSYSKENAELVRNVLLGKPLAGKGERDDAIVRVAPTIAWLLPAGTPIDAAMEIMRESIVSMPQFDDDGDDENPESWMAKAREKYEWAAEKKLRETNGLTRLKVAAEAKTKAKPSASPEAKPSASPEAEPKKRDEAPDAVNDARDEMGEWRLDMRKKVSKSGEVVPEALTSSVLQMLQNHAAWKRPDGKPVLRFNEVTKQIECIGGPIDKADRIPAQLLTAIENWFQQAEKLDVHTNDIERAVFFVARRNAYDPLKDYLVGLRGKWDGVKRLRTFYRDYCGARLTDDDENDLVEYLARTGVKFFVGSVARGLSPGCKMDNVPVWEGAQGIGKSEALRILGGEFFTDSPMVLGDKDSKMLTAQSWLIELAELSAIRKAETELMKATFSAREDKFRPPYGRVVETFPRRCVFVGTTNEDEYLVDNTGNRRFWPVSCAQFNHEKLRQDRDQLWAEAVALYDAGEKHWFEREESEELEAITQQRLRGSEFTETLMEWWQKMEPGKRPTTFSLLDVALDGFGMLKHQISEKEQQIGRAIKQAGFKKVRRRTEGGLVWRYESTEKLRALPKVESRLQQKLRVIEGEKAGAK